MDVFSNFFCLYKPYTDAACKILRYICIFNVHVARSTYLLIIYKTATRRPTPGPNVNLKQIFKANNKFITANIERGKQFKSKINQKS